jgi:hypothetical protein
VEVLAKGMVSNYSHAVSMVFAKDERPELPREAVGGVEAQVMTFPFASFEMPANGTRAAIVFTAPPAKHDRTFCIFQQTTTEDLAFHRANMCLECE